MKYPAADLLPGDRIVRDDDSIVIVKAKLPTRTIRAGERRLRFVAIAGEREGIIEYTERASVRVEYE